MTKKTQQTPLFPAQATPSFQASDFRCLQKKYSVLCPTTEAARAAAARFAFLAREALALTTFLGWAANGEVYQMDRRAGMFLGKMLSLCVYIYI